MSKIFISYRREDSAYAVGHIDAKLREQFGNDHVFTDVDDIPLGVDFRAHLDAAVSQCDILLAVIGDRWLSVANKGGQRRLDDPRDYVKIEIESALRRDIPVIPVLVDGSSMPAEEQLPESLKNLAYKQAQPIRPGADLYNDIDRLTRGLTRHLSRVEEDPIPDDIQDVMGSTVGGAENTDDDPLESLHNRLLTDEGAPELRRVAETQPKNNREKWVLKKHKKPITLFLRAAGIFAVFGLIAYLMNIDGISQNVSEDDLEISNHSPSESVESVGLEWTFISTGTFAMSNLPNNATRDFSYSNASKERNRIATYLPEMTFFNKSGLSQTRSGYVEGVTRSGIPVEILESKLSNGLSNNFAVGDVVVHQTHSGCRVDVACREEKAVQVLAGSTFSIKHEDEEKIELSGTDGLRIVYSKTEFASKEERGILSRYERLINSHWSYYDGYALLLSTACNGKRNVSDVDIRIPIRDYDSDPSTWDVNDKRWSLKAIEIFDLGTVTRDEDADYYIGSIFYDIEDQMPGTVPTAIDFTIFAYRDSTWKSDYYQFSGLLQILNCQKPPDGPAKPTYVTEAYLYFDTRVDDNYIQSFPLTPVIELPQQFSESNQAKIYEIIDRSFFYSINSSRDYERVLEKLSEKIPYPFAVANVIARLNASCNLRDQKKCQEYSSLLE